MISSLVIKQFLTYYKSSLSVYPILPRAIYDPDMTFDGEFKRYLVNVDHDFQVDQNTSNWIGIVWNRETIRGSVLNRRFNSLNKTEGIYHADQYSTRFGECVVGISLFSPSISSLESMEEYIYVKRPFTNLTEFNVTIPTTDITFKALTKDFEITDIAVNQEKKMAQLSLNTTLMYPVIVLDQEHMALIEEVILEIYTRLVLPNE